MAIHFIGRPESSSSPIGWVEGVTPRHGELATHLAAGDNRSFAYEQAMAEKISLVFGFSNLRYAEPWYYGVSHGMAFLQVFRPRDLIRLTQSPSGGGDGNPAWDFQFFAEDYEVGRREQFVMRAVYVPYESPEQMRALAEKHLAEISRDE